MEPSKFSKMYLYEQFIHVLVSREMKQISSHLCHIHIKVQKNVYQHINSDLCHWWCDYNDFNLVLCFGDIF
jgi:hypothetical protein